MSLDPERIKHLCKNIDAAQEQKRRDASAVSGSVDDRKRGQEAVHEPVLHEPVVPEPAILHPLVQESSIPGSFEPTPRPKSAPIKVPPKDNPPVIQYIPTQAYPLCNPWIMITILVLVIIIMLFIYQYANFLKGTVIEVKDAVFSFCLSAVHLTAGLAHSSNPRTPPPGQSSVPKDIPYVFRYVKDWGPALQLASKGIELLGEGTKDANYHTLPTANVKKLMDFNVYFDKEPAPSLAQAPLDVQYLVKETMNNPVSVACFDKDLLKPWWEFWTPSCKARLVRDFETLLSILLTAQESCSWLDHDIEEINEILSDILTDTCRTAKLLQRQRANEVSQFSPSEDKGIDTYLAQLSHSAETLEFGCEMAGVDRDLAAGRASCIKRELMWLDKVVEQLGKATVKMSKGRMERFDVVAVKNREDSLLDWAKEWLDVTGRYYLE